MSAKTHIHATDLVLRCLAMKRRNYWVAMCVDLDLTVQADTLPQARKLLKGQISSYVAEATGIDGDHAGVLLSRKAPIQYRLMYRFAKLVHNARKRLSFETAMPMIPAGA